MNRKLGITKNSSTKSDQVKFSRNGAVNSNGKRQTDHQSESEEDSKSKLITKKAKKTEALRGIKETRTNPAASVRSPDDLSTLAQPSNRSISAKTATLQSQTLKAIDSRSEGPSISDVQDRQLNGAISPPTNVARSTLPDLPKLAEIRAETHKTDDTRTNGTNETKEQERKRLKRERKKERKRLKKERERQQEASAGKD